MQIQLDTLIEKIKKDGVLEAKRKAEEIIKQAQEQKDYIIKKAREEAETIIKEAGLKASRLKDNSQKAVAQAVRDTVLILKQRIKDLFDRILKEEIQRSLNEDLIARLILRIAESWGKDKQSDLQVSLSPQDKEGLEAFLLSKFKAELSSGINFKANPNINKGLYIGIKGEDFHYDFTDEAILEILKQYLRPFIVRIIEEEAG